MIDIILPTFDNVEFIKGCLDSISGSFSSSYHIYLGIDGCTKTELKMRGEDLSAYNISIYMSKNNVGPYVIKNSLVESSSSDSIVFFDTDDEMLKCFGHDICKALEKYNYVRFKYEQEELQNGKIKNKYPMNKIAEGVFAIKRQLFNKYRGFFPWRCGADTEFLERLKHKKEEYFTINKPLFVRRLHANNLTMHESTNYRSEVRRQYLDIIEKKKQTSTWNNPIPIMTDFELIYENKIT